MGENMFKDKKNKIKIIFVIFLAFVLILISIFFINNDRKLNVPEKLIKDGFLFLSNLFTIPVNYINEKISQISAKNNLYEKYKDLEAKITSYDLVVSEKETLKKEIDELKKVVGINNVLSEKFAMNAVVVHRNIDYWHDEITIDKGSKDGIVEGMPVVTNEGLIGRITSVSNFNSVVKLLTSSNSSKISVKIQVGVDYVYGLLSGYDAQNNTYQVEGISQNVKLENDSLVTTTGMGDIFPSGIFIGKVVGTRADSYDLSILVEVSPSVNFNDFSVVSILKRNIDA